jgi:hypothetical protein
MRRRLLSLLLAALEAPATAQQGEVLQRAVGLLDGRRQPRKVALDRLREPCAAMSQRRSTRPMLVPVAHRTSSSS